MKPKNTVLISLAIVALIGCSDDNTAGNNGKSGDTASSNTNGTGTDKTAGDTADGTDTTSTGGNQNSTGDLDSDGYLPPFDCANNDPAINPDALEVQGNNIDDDCDGQTDELETVDTATNGGTDGVCAASDFTITPAPVTLMILQDMSGSMDPYYDGVGNDKWDDFSNPGRWSIVKPAIKSLLATFGSSQIEFGLDYFPSDGGSCSVSNTPEVDCAPGNATQISNSLPGDNAPDGATPLLKAMDNYTDANFAPGCLDPDKQRYLLVVSDGEDSCEWTNSFGNSATATQLGNEATKLLGQGVKTFAIGFGDGVDTTQLNAIAANGGTQYDTFLPAGDQAQLEAAFNQIASSIVNCNYDVPAVGDNANRDDVNFYFDDVVVPFDDGCSDGTGWSWTNSAKDEVMFCATACDQLQNGDVAVSARWGCPTVSVSIN